MRSTNSLNGPGKRGGDTVKPLRASLVNHYQIYDGFDCAACLIKSVWRGFPAVPETLHHVDEFGGDFVTKSMRGLALPAEI